MLKVSNLKKPDSKKWKLVGDILVYGLIPELGIIAGLEGISIETKFWLAFGIAQASLISKVITKFTTDEQV